MALTKKEQDRLAIRNELTEERYADNVKGRVQGEGIQIEDEVAIHRKAIAYLFKRIADRHEGELTAEEFEALDALIERIKSEERAELGIKRE